MKKVKYTQDGVAFQVPEFDMLGWRTVDHWVEEHRDSLIDSIFDALVVGITKDLLRVPVFLVQGSDVIMNITKDTYLHNISRCIEHYADIEKYERCALLKKLEELFKKDRSEF